MPNLDVTTPTSPGWWLTRLIARLQAERAEVALLERYYNGDHPLPEGAKGYADSYRTFQRLSRSNYLSLVVEAPLERMSVVGFRSGATGTDVADDKTWELWQRAHMDADQVLVHRSMLSLRRSFVIVGPHPRKRGEVLITVEHPSQVCVIPYQDDRRIARAALKMFVDDITGRVMATVYLPDRIITFRAPGSLAEGLSYDYRLNATQTADSGVYAPEAVRSWEVMRDVRNPFGEVPVVEFANRADSRGNARSEFEDVIDVQNRINTTLLHRLVSEKFGAFRQKAILNLEFGEDDDGNVVAPTLPSDPSAAWLLEGENLSLFEFSQNDTAQIIAAVTTDIRDLAAITRTPPHYLLGGIVNSSGDALKAAETGLTAKVKERSLQAGESWEIVMHLAHLVKGDRERASVSDMETIWRDPESRTLGELADSVLKKATAGVPWRQRMIDLGYSPQVIKRMDAERTQDALLTSLSQAPAPEVGKPAGAPQNAPQDPAPAPDPSPAP